MNIKLIILISIFSLTSCRIVRISRGYTGIIEKRNNEVDTTKILNEGIYQIGISRKVIILKSGEQKIEDHIPNCKLKNGSSLELSYQFRFKPDEQYLPQLYRDISERYPDYIVIPTVRKLIRDTLIKYSPSDLSEEFISKIIYEKVLNKNNWSKFIIPVNFYLIDIKYSEIVDKSIKAGLQHDLEALENSDPKIRIEAVKRLINNNSKTAYLILFEHWQRERNSDIKDFIINELSKTNSP